jgi:large subunit ribosomal protein L6
MSSLARIKIYTPEFLFFEMQQFRQNYVCWFSGPYYTRKMKFSINRHFEIDRTKKLQLKAGFVEVGSRFYETLSNQSIQVRHKKTSLIYQNMKHWVVGSLTGFQNALRLRGIGYKFDISFLKITIQVGYSHLIYRKMPSQKRLHAVSLNKKATFLKSKSSDLTFLHTFLGSIRNSHPPDVYKGKGIRYQKDFVSRKEGKKKKTS